MEILVAGECESHYYFLTGLLGPDHSPWFWLLPRSLYKKSHNYKMIKMSLKNI